MIHVMVNSFCSDDIYSLQNTSTARYTLLIQLYSVGTVILCWYSYTLLVQLYSVGTVILCWYSYTLLVQLYSVGTVILCWYRYTLLIQLYLNINNHSTNTFTRKRIIRHKYVVSIAIITTVVLLFCAIFCLTMMS